MRPELLDVKEISMLVDADWLSSYIEPSDSLRWATDMKGLCSACPLACYAHPMARDTENEHQSYKLYTLTVIKAGFIKITGMSYQAEDIEAAQKLIDGMGKTQSTPKPLPEPSPDPPLQVEKPHPPKPAFIFGWMSAETSAQKPAQLYVERAGSDWGVTYDPAAASRFKSVEAVLTYYRKIGSVHQDHEQNIFNGFLRIFLDDPAGLRLMPRITRQVSLFDNLSPLEIIEKQPDLITTTICTADQFSRDEQKLIAAGYVLVKYDREAKSIQQTYIESGNGWTPAITFKTFAAAEKTLKEAIALENVVEVTLDGKVNFASCRSKLFKAGFDFYRTEGIISGHGHDVPRIKQASKNWGTWGKYEHPYQLKNAWDELMKDEKALIG